MVKSSSEKSMDKLTFPIWRGEFGWEVMMWQAKCRYIARQIGLGKEQILVRSFRGMNALYEDFATFEHHGETQRILGFKPKHYRTNGIWLKFGNPNHDKPKFKYLFHARGYGKGKTTEISRWMEIVREVPNCGCIGTLDDFHLPGTVDLRGCDLSVLMDYMAAAEKVIGQSSGPMHLAALCGTELVVWGDNRTYFNETLEKRYKETWNPHGVRVTFVFTDLDWQPEPDMIRRAM